AEDGIRAFDVTGVQTCALPIYGPDLTLKLETDAALLGHEQELHSVFYNLISNAVRFTPRPGRVEIVWRRAGEGAVFEVIDTGIEIGRASCRARASRSALAHTLR